jgi:hypothetical protein
LRGLARIGLGRCAIAEGDLDEAIRHFGVARKLLPSGSQHARVRLYLGEAQLRAGAINSGLNQLETAFPSLVDADDRSRAAFLITGTLDQLGDAVPALYRTAAGGHSYPEYSSIWRRTRPAPPTVVGSRWETQLKVLPWALGPVARKSESRARTVYARPGL